MNINLKTSPDLCAGVSDQACAAPQRLRNLEETTGKKKKFINFYGIKEKSNLYEKGN